MGRSNLDELLQPSLQSEQWLKPPYSVRAGFFVAFFGGLLAAVAFAALNSIRTQRVARDGLWLGLIACGAVASSIWAGYAIQTGGLPSWLVALGGPRQAVRLLGRVLGILGFGAIYLLQRDMHETRDLRGQEAPSAWWPGILACVAALVVQFPLALVGVLIGRS